jgi:nitroimidazol reductase NimA-like FMN-containing flavoprotein (pyridoxamine 5'-phosphate oxidase superfamily)
MYSDGAALRQLTSDDCLRLLATVPFGRIIYTRQALPAVELVNFALEGGDIIIRTDRSGKLAAATRGAIVAFEADVVDADQRSGWSVTAIGPARAVADAADIARLQRIGLDSWAPGVREHFIRITPQLLNGRWLGASHRAYEVGGAA